MFDNALKFVGFSVNFALLLFFAISAVCLTSYGTSFLEAAGGVPALSSVISVVKSPIIALNNVIHAFSTGTIYTVSFNYIGAWATLVSAAGAWWMTALGIRWHYYAALRLIDALEN